MSPPRQAALDTAASTRDVLPAHQLDEPALLRYLRATLPDLARPGDTLTVRQFAHGQSNPTYLLTLAGAPNTAPRRAVLRKQPPGHLLASAHAVDREHRVLAALSAAAAAAGARAPPVPCPLAMCADASVLGTPFYVMAHAQGTVYVDPRMPGASPKQRAAAYAGLADTLAALHGVDAAAAGLAGYGAPHDYCRRQVARWARQYAASVSTPDARVERLVAWLSGHVPPEDADPGAAGCAGVVHGDYRLDNLVFGPRMEVVAVLDWELSTLGNVWADVAYAAMAHHLPPQLTGLALTPPPLPPGVPDEAALLARYCSARGIAPPPPPAWAFYVALSLFRLLAILAGVQARSRQGNASSAAAAAISSDEVLAALAERALAVVDAADGAADGGSSASAKRRPPPPRAPSLGAPSARAAALLDAVRAFVETRVLPAEAALTAHALSDARWTIHPLQEALKVEAKALGLWNLWLPGSMANALHHLLPLVPAEERGALLGARLSHLDYAHVCSAMGRSVWAPEAFNCSAPDTGNMEVLARYGTPQQQVEWLLPLLRGKARSCFAMTEKAVASSDATNITARITRVGGDAEGGYVLDGLKWWTSGAMDPRCKICIFMGKTRMTGPAHAQQSMVLVPMSAPGVHVVRPLTVYGYDDAPHGHAEVEFARVAVPRSALLLGEGRGFEIAQGRLGPGRLHHCMRLMGMAERALELLADRSLARVAFGGPLARQGALRDTLARLRVRVDGARLLVLQAADALDRVGYKAARGEIAAAKVAAPAAALAALDAAVQVHGGAGVSQDTVLAAMWAGARTLRIADGPDEVHLESIAKLELRRRQQQQGGGGGEGARARL